jgi:hypothetical protein
MFIMHDSVFEVELHSGLVTSVYDAIDETIWNEPVTFIEIFVHLLW